MPTLPISGSALRKSKTANVEMEMKDKTLIEQIRNTAKAAQESGQSVSIDAVLPTVCVTRGVDDVFFFRSMRQQSF